MKPILPLLALALLSCSPAAPEPPRIAVEGAWARATLAGKPSSAAYFTVINGGAGDDVLTGVTSRNGTAELHSTSMDGGIMRMRKLDRLPVPAGATVRLEPGGAHVMLTGLREPLAAGQGVELTLRFEKSQQQTVAAEIRDPSGDRM